MRISLRTITTDDLQLVEKAVDVGDASSFMSRWFPRSFASGCWSKHLTRWHIILADRDEVGTIWMERASESSTRCDLGILIFNSSFRGRGLGRQAIALAEQDAVASWGIDLVSLRVRQANQRAISCYSGCGYEITNTTSKVVDGVETRVVHMDHCIPG